MYDLFPEYYKPDKDEFKTLWQECIFVFDTNILLNLYRMTPEGRDNLLEEFQKFADRIWIPYQVASEYQKNRVKVIIEQDNAYYSVLEQLKSIEKYANLSIEKLREYKQHHPHLDIESITNNIVSFLTDLKEDIESLKSCHPNLLDVDEIREQLDIIFEGKIGNQYPDNELEKISTEGKIRYEKEIPPGYMDDKDKDEQNKYGDLIIWKQILDYAKEKNCSIIFVTDEKKEDWWWEVKGKRQGPRVELIREFLDYASNKFHMYSQSGFLHFAKQYINFETTPETEQEVKSIEEFRSILDWRVSYPEISNQISGINHELFNTYITGIRNALQDTQGISLYNNLNAIEHGIDPSIFTQSLIGSMGQQNYINNMLAQSIAPIIRQSQDYFAGLLSENMANINYAFGTFAENQRNIIANQLSPNKDEQSNDLPSDDETQEDLDDESE